MREDLFAVLRWLATDDLDGLAGYYQSVADCERLCWLHGLGGQRRLTAAGRNAYDVEFARRRHAGFELDTDPLNLAA